MDRKRLASKCVWGNDIFMFYNRALWNDTGFWDRGVQYNALVDNKTLNTKSKCIVLNKINALVTMAIKPNTSNSITILIKRNQFVFRICVLCYVN